jgi:hypothetical protein
MTITKEQLDLSIPVAGVDEARTWAEQTGISALILRQVELAKLEIVKNYPNITLAELASQEMTGRIWQLLAVQGKTIPRLVGSWAHAQEQQGRDPGTYRA